MVASLEKPPEAGKALSLPLGVVSPLWMMFAGAATAGVAYWWMTRWTRPINLEARLAAPEPVAQPVVEAASEPDLEPVAEIVPVIATAPVAAEVPAVEEPPLKLRRRSTKVAEAS